MVLKAYGGLAAGSVAAVTAIGCAITITTLKEVAFGTRADAAGSENAPIGEIETVIRLYVCGRFALISRSMDY